MPNNEEGDLVTLDSIFEAIYQIESTEQRQTYLQAFNKGIFSLDAISVYFRIKNACKECTDLTNADHIDQLKVISLDDSTQLSIFFKVATDVQINWLISDIFKSHKDIPSIQKITEKLYIAFKNMQKSEVIQCSK